MTLKLFIQGKIIIHNYYIVFRLENKDKTNR